jgi:hypothetical protein
LSHQLPNVYLDVGVVCWGRVLETNDGDSGCKWRYHSPRTLHCIDLPIYVLWKVQQKNARPTASLTGGTVVATSPAVRVLPFSKGQCSDERLFANAFEHAPNGMAILDCDGAHVLDGDPGSRRSAALAISVRYVFDAGRAYEARRLELPTNDLDIALIQTATPFRQFEDSVEPPTHTCASALKRGETICFIGRSGDWHIPQLTGTLRGVDEHGRLSIQALQSRRGSSAAPLLTSGDAVAGMIVSDQCGDQDTLAIPFDSILALVKRTHFDSLGQPISEARYKAMLAASPVAKVGRPGDLSRFGVELPDGDSIGSEILGADARD